MEGTEVTSMSPETWGVVIVAIAGLIGTLVAGLGGPVIQHRLQNSKQNKIDEARKKLLKSVLTSANKNGWMELHTLAHLVGANFEETRRLLIEIDARGSLRTNNEVWSLISRNPLPTGSDD